MIANPARKPTRRVPGGPARRRLGAAGQLRRVRRPAAVRDRRRSPGTRSSGPDYGRELAQRRRSSARPPAGRAARRAGRAARRGSRPRARPRRRRRGESPTWNASLGLAPRAARARRGTRAGSGFAAPTTADDTAPSSSGASPARSSPSGSETSQLLATTSRTPRARSSRSARRRVRERAEAQRGEHRLARRRVVEPVERERLAHLLRAAVAQLARAASHVAALDVVREVVADLRANAAARALLADVDAACAARARRAARGAGGSSSTSVPSASSEHRLDGAHEIHSQVANCAVNRPSPTAERRRDRARRSRAPRVTTASHMNSGNSTARKRGSDISGCGATG